MKDVNAAITLLEKWPEKISGSERDSNPWPLCYRCNAPPTELSKPQVTNFCEENKVCVHSLGLTLYLFFFPRIKFPIMSKENHGKILHGQLVSIKLTITFRELKIGWNVFFYFLVQSALLGWFGGWFCITRLNVITNH